jgi:hypothetical protein
MRLEMLRRELAQGAETIQDLVAGVSAEEARVRPSPEAWSILEVVALGATLSAFLTERERSLAWLAGLTAPDRSRGYQASFGPITAGDLAASWAAHDLLHARQLLELRRARLLALAAPHRTGYAGDW